MILWDFDVLVVGGGGAAIRAAIAAYESNHGMKVGLVTKGILGKSGVTANACSDRMAFHATLKHTEPVGKEAWKYHADDIYRIGGYVSDYDLAKVLALNSCEAYYYLENLGVPFVLKNGQAQQFVTDGSRYARACYTGPLTAIHIEKALVDKVKTMPVTIIENCMVTDLLLEDGIVHGVFALKDMDGEICIRCKSVIMACGGAGEVYADNVFSSIATGDGIAMSFRAGAELVNLEFIQIGPSSKKTGLACSGSLMRSVPRIVNEEDKEFLIENNSEDFSFESLYNLEFMKGLSWPLSNEDESHVLDVAIFREIQKGHRVFLDFSKNPSNFNFNHLNDYCRMIYNREIKTPVEKSEREKSPFLRLCEINPNSIEWLKEYGIDLKKGDTIEIVPAIQHFQGGIKIGRDASTNIRGLFAAGECAGGQHGANRPGGNALMDCQVFGKIAGEAAALFAESAPELGDLKTEIDTYHAFLEKVKEKTGTGIPSDTVRKQVRQLMSRHASVIRTRTGLLTALEKIKAIRNAGFNPDSNGLAYHIETINIVETAILLLTSMLQREESRGPHLFFADEKDKKQMPRNDAAYSHYIVLRKQDNHCIIEKRKPVKPASDDELTE